MPYAIRPRGGKFQVYNKHTGDVKGTHATREKAERQRRLLEMVKHGGTPTRAAEGLVVLNPGQLIREGYAEERDGGR